MGFIIAGTIIVLYVFLITKALYVAKTAKDTNGSLIASGIAGIFMFHMAENVGMVMGLLPITGVPLLFVSYGGSSLITSYILIGILLNISSKLKIHKNVKLEVNMKELSNEVVVAKIVNTTEHGAIQGKTQTHVVEYYNLDVIISVGYCVKSKNGVIFRK